MGLLDSLLKSAVKGVTAGVKDAGQKAANKAGAAVAGAIKSETEKAVSSAVNTARENAEKQKAAEEAAAAEAAAAAQVAYTAALQQAACDPSQNRKHAPADLSGYMGSLAEEWNNQKETGFVWTVTINDTAVIDAFGLTKVNYTLNLSCSHVGPTINGVYRGSMGMVYHADYTGLKLVMASAAGTINAPTDNWFRNDNFLMRLAPYSAEDQDMFIQTLGSTAPADATEEAKQLAESFDAAIGAADIQKNKAAEPACAKNGYWCDWEYRNTAGDMSGYAKASVLCGMVKADASVSADGHEVKGDGVGHIPFVGTFREHYEETVDGPFPYQLRTYENGTVLFDLYGPKSSNVFVRFKGTWDKIPVEDTVKV